MKKLVIGAAVVALHAAPVLAIQGDARPDRSAPQTRAQVQAKVQERFGKIDANRDGAVTQAEFDAHRNTMKAERSAERFASLDSDRNGQISRAEFDAGASARKARRDEAGADGKSHHGRHMRGHHRGMGGNWFARLDANKDGRVTLAEATAKPLAMFDRADANKDGTVTPEERKAARDALRAEWGAKRS